MIGPVPRVDDGEGSRDIESLENKQMVGSHHLYIYYFSVCLISKILAGVATDQTSCL